MKFGFHTPTLKKVIKGRTTCRVKRAMKKTIKPVYGKKCIGFISNTRRSVYNKIYKKLSFGLGDIFKLFK